METIAFCSSTSLSPSNTSVALSQVHVHRSATIRFPVLGKVVVFGVGTYEPYVHLTARIEKISPTNRYWFPFILNAHLPGSQGAHRG